MSNISINILKIFCFFCVYTIYRNWRAYRYIGNKGKESISLFVVLVIYSHYYKFLDELYKKTINTSNKCTIQEEILTQVVLFDFLYYIIHRYLFHSRLGMKYIHGEHHLYRNSTFYSSLYENLITCGLFFLPTYMLPIREESLYISISIVLWIAVENHTKKLWNNHYLHHTSRIGNYGLTPLFDDIFCTQL